VSSVTVGGISALESLQAWLMSLPVHTGERQIIGQSLKKPYRVFSSSEYVSATPKIMPLIHQRVFT